MKLLGGLLRLWRGMLPGTGAATGAKTRPSQPAPRLRPGAAAPRATAPVDPDEVELSDALDRAFAGRNTAEARPAAAKASAQDVSENRKLFAAIAANFSRPLKDFMLELKRGSAPEEWIEICRPVIASLVEAGRSVDVPGLSSCLGALDKTLADAQKDQGSSLRKARRERILFLYRKLEQILPEAFAIDEAASQRESIVIHSLLRRIPEVGYVTLEKLYRVGLTSRETLFRAQPADLVSLAGVPLELSTRICEELQAYQRQSQGSSPEALFETRRARLAELVPELRRHHEAFTEACDRVSIDRDLVATKQEARKRRQACALEIEVLLAEMGQVPFAREIQSLSVEQRINKLEEHLSSLPRAPAASPPAEDAERMPSPTLAGR